MPVVGTLKIVRSGLAEKNEEGWMGSSDRDIVRERVS